MSNFTATFKSGLFFNFNTVVDIDKLMVLFIDADEITELKLNPLFDGNLEKVTHGFLDLFKTINLPLLERLENGEFDPLLNQMDGIDQLSVSATNNDYNQ